MIRKVGANRSTSTRQAARPLPHSQPLPPSQARGAAAAPAAFRLDGQAVRPSHRVLPGEAAEPITPPRVFEQMETQRRQIDRMIDKATRGEQFRAAELLVWQARVYAYSQQMDILSKVVDRTVSALKTTLNTQI